MVVSKYADAFRLYWVWEVTVPVLVEKLKHDNFDGIDAILSVVPYYNKPSQGRYLSALQSYIRSNRFTHHTLQRSGRTGMNMTAEQRFVWHATSKML